MATPARDSSVAPAYVIISLLCLAGIIWEIYCRG